MVGLPATGTLEYNGYEFDGASRVNVSVRMNYDDNGRTVISQTYTINVEFVVADDSSTDSDLESIRKKLVRPGQVFKFTNRGFGDDLIVSSQLGAQGVLPDIADGPSPQIVNWAPLGDNKAAEVEWSIEFTIAMCAKGVARTKGVMAMNWGTTYSIDEFGDTTRVLSGYIQIVQVARSEASDTADAYRNRFSPAAVPGFKRTQEWKLSTDRARIEFTITDTQIPSPRPYPLGIQEIDASWTYERNREVQGATLSVTASPAAGVSGAQVWGVFLNLVALKKAAVKKGTQTEMILYSLNIDESIFSRSQSISATFKIAKRVEDYLGTLGLWQPIGTSWTRWLTSVPFMHNFRGHAGMYDLNLEDVVIDLCMPERTIRPNNYAVQLGESPSVRGTLQNTMPTADKSFTKFKSRVAPSHYQPVTRHSTIQDTSEDNNYAPMPTADEDLGGIDRFSGGNNFATESPPATRIADTIQVAGAPRYSVRYYGEAERIGYPIARPKVTKIGNRDAVEVSGNFVQRSMGDVFGVPVYQAAWVLDYMVDNSPGRIDIPGSINV